MNNQALTKTSSSSTPMTEDEVKRFMKSSIDALEWKVREKQLKLRLGDNFNNIYTEAVLLSGLAEEMERNFQNHTSPQHKKEVNLAEGISDVLDLSEKSERIAPL